MTILYLGIDLAKNVFALHGVNAAGKPELVRPKVARAQLHELVALLPACTIGMEACSGAHHWARLFAQHGHTVRLIAPKFVAPYRIGLAPISRTVNDLISSRFGERRCRVIHRRRGACHADADGG